MPVIHVEMFAGRDRQKKAEIARELTDTFVRVAGGKPEGVTIIFAEVDRENWSAGGTLVADRDGA